MLIINELFHSIQGESTYAGLPCVFVRLTGCNLRCSYCDTTYAYEGGESRTVEEVVNQVKAFPARLVEITGGEPLLQPETTNLVQAFANRGWKVLLETNGAMPIDAVDPRATVIMDIKCPGSGMSDRVLWENLSVLKPLDEVKFVLTDRTDYEWALEVIERYRLAEKHIVHLSPAFGVLDPSRLASWMLKPQAAHKPGPRVRLQLQLHKYIWPHAERGV